MKQTKNALSMLLNAYRSVYKSAYFKGLASAVVLTAGLTVGATANAYNYITETDLTDSAATITIGSAADLEQDQGVYLTVSGNATNFSGSIKILNGLSQGTGSTSNFVSGGSISGTGELTLDVKTEGNGLYVGDTAASGGSVNLKTITVNNGTIKVTAGNDSGASVAGDTVSLTGSKSNVVLTASNNKSGDAVLGRAAVAATNGEPAVIGSAITLSNGATVTMSGGSTDKGQAKIEGASLALNDENTQVLVDGSTANAFGEIAAESLTINVASGGVIVSGAGATNSGSLTISSQRLTLSAGSIAAEKAGDKITITSNDGTINGAQADLSTVSGASITLALATLDDKGEVVERAQSGWAANYDAGRLEANAGQINVGGKLLINQGTLAVNGADLFTTETFNKDAAGTVVIDGQVDESNRKTGDGDIATLEISSTELKGFLSPAADSTVTVDGEEKTLTSGGVTVQSGGVIAFNDNTAVDLSSFAFSGSANTTAGKITLGDEGGVFKADNLTVAHALTTDGKAVAGNDTNVLAAGTGGTDLVSLEANTLTLGSSALSSANSAKIKFGSATVHDELVFDVDTSADGAFKFIANADLDAKTLVDADKGIYTEAAGTVRGDVTELGDGTANSGALNVVAGNWTAEQAITMNSGSISVTADTEHKVDSTLTFAQALKVNLKVQNDITVDGKSTDAYELDQRDTLDYTYEGTVNDVDDSQHRELALLDLRNGITINSTGAAADTTIKATSGGIILLDDADVEEIGALTTEKGVKLMAEKNGALIVNDELNLDIDDFGTGANQVNLEDGGILEAPTVVLTHDEDVKDDALGSSSAAGNYAGQSLDIGSGTISTAAFTLSDNTEYYQEVKDSTPTAYALAKAPKVTFLAGNLEISDSLTVGNAKLVVGGDTSHSANITLESDLVGNSGTIAVGNGTGMVSLQADAGQQAPSFAIINGAWTAAGVTFDIQSGSLTLGEQNPDEDANGDEYQASLTAAGLSVGANGTVKVENNGTAVFDTLILADNATGVTVAGSLTINGVADADLNADKTADQGVILGDGSQITVSNHGYLNFGEAATNAFISTDVKATDTSVTVNAGYTGKINNQGGEVRLDLSGSTLGDAALADLKDKIFTEGSVGADGLLVSGGFINVGGGSLGITFEDQGYNGASVITWDNLKDFADGKSDVTSDALKNAIVTEVAADAQFRGQVGALVADTNVNSITIAGDTSLNNATANDGYFASNSTRTEAVDLKVINGKQLTLNGAGEAGTVSLDNDADLVTAAGTGIITLEAIDGEHGDVSHLNGTLNVTNDVDVDYLEVLAGSFNVTKTATVKELSVEVGGQFSADTLELADDDNEPDYIAGRVAVNNLNVNSNNDALIVADGGVLSAKTATFVETAGNIVYVGTDSYTEDASPFGEAVEGSTGMLEFGTAYLNGATIFVDPEYGKATSLAAVGKFGDKPTTVADSDADLGLMDGNIVIGKNAAAGIGTDLAGLQAAIAGYQSNGSLLADEYGSILYVNGSLHIADGKYIAVNADANANGKTDVEEVRDYSYVDNGATINGKADLGLSENAAIIMTDQAFTNKNGQKTETAIHFDTNSAVVNVAGDNSTIILQGSFSARETLNIFSDNDADGKNGVRLTGGTITVTSENGLLTYTMQPGANVGQNVGLEFNELEGRAILSGASDPVYQHLRAYACGVVNPDAADADRRILTNGEYLSAEAYTALSETDPEAAAEYIAYGDGYTKSASSDFLDAVITTGNGADAESVARLAVYGGAAEVALAASSTTYEAINSRLGMGNPNGNLIMADNANGAGIWLAPVYKNHESDDFDAQGVDYGVDLDLTGVALGADYTFAQGFRAGVMFNIGSGDADGQGAGSAVSNDFDYWSAGIYGGYAYGNFSLAADVTYTAVDNDIDANTAAAGKVSASMDADVISAGITGQYKFEFSALDVTPHLGVRYSYIDIDDYSIADIASSNVDELSVFSIPVGVTLSKDFATASGWNIKPALDLVVTANTGDDEVDSDITFNGVDYNTDLSTEFMDSVTYDATLGLQVQKDAFQFGLGVNYTGSENTDEYGVTANARFTF